MLPVFKLKGAVVLSALGIWLLPGASPGSVSPNARISDVEGSPRVCYFVADNDGLSDSRDVLTMLNPETGVESVIGLTGTDFIETLAFSPFRSTLFAVDGGTFGSMNLFSGKFNEIGKVGHGIGSVGDRTFNDIDGLTVDADTGVLYGSVRQDSDNLLIQINPTTGSIVDHAFGIRQDYAVIHPIAPGFFVDDLAASPTDGLLYAVVTDSVQSLLVTIDKITAAASFVTEIDAREVEGLTFDASGILFGTIGSAGRRVIKIDIETGAVEERFKLGAGGNLDYEAIDCVTTAALPPPDFTPSDTRAPGDIRTEGAFPVPADQRITIRVKFTKTLAASLDVFDLLGRRVEHQPERVFGAGVYDIPIETSQLVSGTYNYRWRSRLQTVYGDFVVAR